MTGPLDWSTWWTNLKGQASGIVDQAVEPTDPGRRIDRRRHIGLTRDVAANWSRFAALPGDHRSRFIDCRAVHISHHNDVATTRRNERRCASDAFSDACGADDALSAHLSSSVEVFSGPVSGMAAQGRCEMSATTFAVRKWKIGDATVTSVIETTVTVPLESIPSATPDYVNDTTWLPAESSINGHQLEMIILAFIVEIGGARIMLDPCVGNGRHRIYQPFSMLNTTSCHAPPRPASLLSRLTS